MDKPQRPWKQQLIAQMVGRDREALERLGRLADLHDTGGQRRKFNGLNTEDLVEMMLENIMRSRFPGTRFRIKRNSDIGKKQDPIIHTEPDGTKLEVSLDLHLYVQGLFLLAIECKAYLDGNMAKVTAYNSERLKSTRPGLKCVVVETEHALGKEASRYHEARGAIDRIFSLTSGKRNSQRPRHLANKCLEPALVDQLVDFIVAHLAVALDAPASLEQHQD